MEYYREEFVAVLGGCDPEVSGDTLRSSLSNLMPFLSIFSRKIRAKELF